MRELGGRGGGVGGQGLSGRVVRVHPSISVAGLRRRACVVVGGRPEWPGGSAGSGGGSIHCAALRVEKIQRGEINVVGAKNRID